MIDINKFNYRIGCSLKADDVESILFHSSIHPQDPVAYITNKQLIGLGNSLAQALYGMFLYRNGLIDNSETMSLRINGNLHKRMLDNIYNHFGLEEFVYKSKEEEEKCHPAIANKLIALIYRKQGIGSLYNFLLPHMKCLVSEVDFDYKTLVQEYSQKNRLPFGYEVLDMSGPEHEMQYKCRFFAGEMTAEGMGIGKKTAQKAAAKAFTQKFNIQPKQNAIVIKPELRKKHYFSEERASQLIECLKLLQVDFSALSIELMERVFTHVSFLNETRDKTAVANGCLAVIGAQILQVMCIEYCLGFRDLTDINIQKTTLLNMDNLAKAVPDKCLKYLLQGKSTDQRQNKTARNRFKIDILEGICASLWLSYLENNDPRNIVTANKLAHKSFDKAEEGKILDYRTIVSESLAKKGFSFKEEADEYSVGKFNAYVARSKVRCEGDGWEEEAIGYGRTNTAAVNSGCKSLLQKIIPHFLQEGDEAILERMLRNCDPETRIVLESSFTGKSDLLIGNNTKINTPNTIIKPLKVVVHDSIPKDVQFYRGAHTLYICKGTSSCRKNNHTIVSVTGLFRDISSNSVKMNVNYCSDCKKFFISYSEYCYYRELYGMILGRFSFAPNIINPSGFGNLAEESMLHICGYTVNQIDDYSFEERKRILISIMENQIMSKYRIMEYLQFFINRSQYRYNMRLATDKWVNDLAWTRSYELEKQKKVIIAKIIKH
ncbi:MAG: putative dsRNA-binding protein [Sphaerochaeta sp.]